MNTNQKPGLVLALQEYRRQASALIAENSALAAENARLEKELRETSYRLHRLVYASFEQWPVDTADVWMLSLRFSRNAISRAADPVGLLLAEVEVKIRETLNAPKPPERY